jgi:hypothetical protein
MIRWGKTKTGKNRWRCKNCKVSSVKRRKDTTSRNVNALFKTWILGMNSTKTIAKKKHVSRMTINRRFKEQWKRELHSPFPKLTKDVVIAIDGTTISKDCIVLVAYDVISDQPLGWAFVHKEEYATWYPLLLEISKLASVHAVVSDGQKGLCKAVKELFPNIPHQRCIAHIIRLGLIWLTRNPRYEAGVELRKIVRDLCLAKTKELADLWKKSFEEWDVKHQVFLQERSVDIFTHRKRYTHRKLRGVRALIIGAIKNMFHFTEDPMIPNTTNSVEGGINSTLQELIQRHRGLPTEKKKVLVSHYLIERRDRRKPTQNVT